MLVATNRPHAPAHATGASSRNRGLIPPAGARGRAHGPEDDVHPRRPVDGPLHDELRGGRPRAAGDFEVFLDEVLGPHLKDGDLVVMDNAGAHKDPRVRIILAKYGSKPVYLPPYSPEFNPIELAWSKLKGFLRTTKARTVPALNEALGIGMKVITPQGAGNWFRHCGYRDGHAT